jgi:hypothetical protein
MEEIVFLGGGEKSLPFRHLLINDMCKEEKNKYKQTYTTTFVFFFLRICFWIGPL